MTGQSPIDKAFAIFHEAWFSGITPELDDFCTNHPECGSELRDRIENFIDVMHYLSSDLPIDEYFIDKNLGDFKIIRELGQGAMGKVFEAEQISFNRKVAIKVLNRMSSPSRFKREIEAISRLNHPGIVVLYEAGQHEDLHFFAQELVKDGLTLSHYLDNKKEHFLFPSGYFREVAKIVAQIAVALQHAHESNIIHRDLKPSNILLTPEGKPKITDFGLAKVEDASSLTRTGGGIGGTPHYMSPEQAAVNNIRIDKRTDIFSLGVTLYEMLTLKRPFKGETSLAVMKQIISVDPENPKKTNPLVPRDLSVICQKTMEKKPSKRYQTMEDFSKDLRRFLNGDVILAKPANLKTRFLKQVKRNPVMSAAVGVAVIAIVSFIGYELLWSIPKLKHEKIRAVKAEKETSRQRNIAESEKEKAQTSEKKAIIAKDLADAQYEEIMRLSDLKRLTDLKKGADKLWPAYPENIDGLKKWITQADKLLGRLEDHRHTLMAIQSKGLPIDMEGHQEDRTIHPEWKNLLNLKVKKQSLKKQISFLEKDKSIHDETIEKTINHKKFSQNIVILKKDFTAIEKQINEIEINLQEYRIWKFEDKETEWRYDTLLGLISGLEEITEKENGLLSDIRKRLQFASTVKQKSIGDYRKEWDEAILSISNIEECPQYNGFKLKEQIGFTPIGRDPYSGLWEFTNIQTGAIPDRDKDGRIKLTEDMGLVFVLIPGGSFKMGAVLPSDDTPPHTPNVDPYANSVESPVHMVKLRPFFLSKYEMTQAQWNRVSGQNPSTYKTGALFGDITISSLHPVEQVTWSDCNSALSRLKLRLPTESEWEYAARAGTTTVFWSGDKKESIRDKTAGNICDMFCKNHGGLPRWSYEEWINDGYTVHAPVGCFSPNDFGLYNVIGNVSEWCQDIFNDYKSTPVDGSACSRGSSVRVHRGGGWIDNTQAYRSANRDWYDPNSSHYSLGVRPAFSIP